MPNPADVARTVNKRVNEKREKEETHERMRFRTAGKRQKSRRFL